jgi:hypothetical protein
MKVTMVLRGASQLIAKLKAAASVTMPRAEVYVDAERAGVAAYHATGTGTMPARNPFFLDDRQRRAVSRHVEKGVKDVVAGKSSGMRQAMSDAAKTAAVAWTDNLDRQRHGGEFGAETPTVSRFAPLSQRYRAAKKRQFPGAKILQREGKLKRSIKPRVS